LQRINYLLTFYRTRPVTKRTVRAPRLLKSPQRCVACMNVFTLPPKKPNSAKRRVARVFMFLQHRSPFYIYIPGQNHKIQPHAYFLIRGGRTKDLPGMRYRAICGVYDLDPVLIRSQGRSKYGAFRSSQIPNLYSGKKWY